MDYNFKRRLLVLEDEPDLWKELIEAIFHPAKWEIDFFKTVDVAEQRFDEQGYDCLLVDSKIEGGSKSGRDFLDHVRSIDSHVPIFLFSGYVDGEDAFVAHDWSRFDTVDFIFKDDEQKRLENGKREALQAEYESAYIDKMAQLCEPKLETEYGPLKTVLVHRPYVELNRVDPEDLEWYLLEMPVALESAQKEYQNFLDTLRRNARPIILYTTRLLYDLIRDADEEGRRAMLKQALLHPEMQRLFQVFGLGRTSLSPVLEQRLDGWAQEDPEAIVKRMLRGVSVSEVDASVENGYPAARDHQVVFPVPNMYFMRDPAFALGDRLFLSRMYWPIRRRETPLLRLIFNRHPFFQGTTVVDQQLGEGDEVLSVEGGDIMAIEPGVYAIAESERTDRKAIERIARTLLSKGAERVYHPKIPVKRAFIHLDTVCSIAGQDNVLINSEATDVYGSTLCWNNPDGDPEFIEKGFVEILRDRHGKTPIETPSGGSQVGAEQFRDAVNALSVNPDTIVTYEQNTRTNEKIRSESELTIAEVSGSELVHGLGGPRCMTLPIRRESA